LKADILFNRQISPTYFQMGIHSPEISQKAKPGQFVMVKVRNGIDPLLRRPFSFFRIHKKEFEILYEVVGKGTQIMSDIKKGEEIDLFGPLGNGFVIKKGLKKAVLAAGGIGVAPLFALGERLKGKADITVYMGAKSASSLVHIKEFKTLGNVIIATEDGSRGFRGMVTELIERDLKSTDHSLHLFSCGPHLMLKKISEFAQKKGLPCQVSLESHIGCGFGACLGCVVKVRTGRDKFDYRKVCTDGPVFESSMVVFA
jgi:dihydroorotate dehydrogenase electron transfer subunit